MKGRRVLATVNQWLGLVALLVSLGNLLWAWISRPARDLSTRLDQHKVETEKCFEESEKRFEAVADNFKGHDRRIQRVEDDLRHLPTKKDLQDVELKVTAIKTELDIVAKVVTRIDDFLRRDKP